MASMLLTSSLVVKFIMKSSESELVYESSYVLERLLVTRQHAYLAFSTRENVCALQFSSRVNH